MRVLLFISVVFSIISACTTSPLDLDVDRRKEFIDGGKNPTRLSFYYHFGDSAYEAIVTDTSLLNHIWIEQPDIDNPNDLTVTIPRFVFQLDTNVVPTPEHNPLVRTLCFAATGQPADGVWRTCRNINSWIQGVYLGAGNQHVPFTWLADDQGRQIQLAFYKVNGVNLIKGPMQIIVSEPIYQVQYATYRALITLEY